MAFRYPRASAGAFHTPSGVAYRSREAQCAKGAKHHSKAQETRREEAPTRMTQAAPILQETASVTLAAEKAGSCRGLSVVADSTHKAGNAYFSRAGRKAFEDI